MSLKSLVQALKPKPSIPSTFTLFIVRTGEYEPLNPRLTSLGQDQAVAAAEIIKRRLNGRTVAVVERPLLEDIDLMRPCYGQTASLIAKRLKAPTVKRGHLHLMPELGVDSFELHRIRHETKDFGLSCVVLVENGSYIGHLLRRNGVPFRDVDGLGPPFGSVHQLELTYRPGMGLSQTSARFI